MLNMPKCFKKHSTAIEVGDFNTTHIDNLTDAITYLEQTQPEVILLDLSLPDSQPQDTFFTVQAKRPPNSNSCSDRSF